MRVGTIEMHGDVRALDFSSHRAVLLATSFQFILIDIRIHFAQLSENFASALVLRR